jgi:DNA-binding MarR family transcriptional regulator
MPSKSLSPAADPYASLWARPGYLLRRAHQRNLAIFEEEFAQYPITPVQYAMLTMLNDVARLDAISLLNAAGADQASGAADVRRLRTLGLVERDNSRLERVPRLRLTDSGRRLLVEAQSSMRRTQERLIETLAPEDRLRLVALLNTVVGAGIASEHSPRGPD